MTWRGAGLLLAAAVLGVWGWRSGWPELEILAAGAGAVVLACLLLPIAWPVPQVTLAVGQGAVRVVRGQPADVTIAIGMAGRRTGLRLVQGAVDWPVLTMPLTRRSAEAPLRVALDTSVRGQRRAGPFAVLMGDPLGVVRREVARAEGGVVTVQPRVHPVRRALTTSYTTGESETSSRRSGDQHFHALRDYVLGDEPRSVHWRSSARAGKLVVRQQVSAASTGTTIVLDVDASAYGGAEAFAVGRDPERFELAVEVVASLAAAQLGSAEQVHQVTTAFGAPVVSAPAGAVNAVLDALSVVRTCPPLETAPEELPAVVRRTRAAHVFVVSGAPGHRTQAALTRLGTMARVTLVTVGSTQSVELRGVRSIAVARPEDLVTT